MISTLVLAHIKKFDHQFNIPLKRLKTFKRIISNIFIKSFQYLILPHLVNKPQRTLQSLKTNLMAYNNTLISYLSESSTNFKVWGKSTTSKWDTTTPPNLKEWHLIVGDPNVSYNLCLGFFWPILCKKLFFILIYWILGLQNQNYNS